MAAIALIVTLAGFMVARCDRRNPTVTPADVEVIMATESASAGTDSGYTGYSRETDRWHRKDSIMEKRKNDSVRKSEKRGRKAVRRQPVTYRKRSPLDEDVTSR